MIDGGTASVLVDLNSIAGHFIQRMDGQVSSQQAEGDEKTNTAHRWQLQGLFPGLFPAVTCPWFMLLDIARTPDIACIAQLASLARMIPQWQS